MLRIRLQRTGRRNLAHYRIVVAPNRAPVKGKFVERVGWYNPHSKEIGFQKDRILYWLNVGARPSNTVSKLLDKNKFKHNLIVVKIRPPRKSKTDKLEKSPVKAPAETPVQPGDMKPA